MTSTGCDNSYIMARHRASYEHPGDDEVNEIIGNGTLSEHYLALARDLDVMEAKVSLLGHPPANPPVCPSVYFIHGPYSSVLRLFTSRKRVHHKRRLLFHITKHLCSFVFRAVGRI